MCVRACVRACDRACERVCVACVCVARVCVGKGGRTAVQTLDDARAGSASCPRTEVMK